MKIKLQSCCEHRTILHASSRRLAGRRRRVIHGCMHKSIRSDLSLMLMISAIQESFSRLLADPLHADLDNELGAR
jgi:hypothetical protein